MLSFSKQQQEAANRINSGNIPVVGNVIESDIIEILRNGKKQNARLSSLSSLFPQKTGDYYIKPKGGIPLADLSSDAVNYLHSRKVVQQGGGGGDFSFTLGGFEITGGSVVSLTDIGVPAWAQTLSPSLWIGNAHVSTSSQTAQDLGGIGQFTSNSVVTSLLTIGSNSLSYDSTAQAWHLTGSLYVDGDLSSGYDSGGGGGGFVNMAAVWASLKNTDTDHTYDNEQINSAHLVSALSGYATTTYVTSAIAALVGNAPQGYDTLGELATAVIANTSSISSLATAISGKADASSLLSTITVGSNVYNVVNRNVTLPAYPSRLSDLTEDDNHKFVTLAEKQLWSNKQDYISDLSTIRSGASSGATAYQKPSSGIPLTDLSASVRTSLGKADTALQSETDPTVPSWAKQSSKPTYSWTEIQSRPTKLSDFTDDILSDYYLPLTGGILTGGLTTPSLTVNGTTFASLLATVTRLDSYFEDVNGLIHVKAAWDGLYTEGELSSGEPGGTPPTPAVVNLSDLADVTLTSIASNDMLKWDGTKWVNIPQSAITPDLSLYATKSWVTSQGYLTSASLSGYATQSWVNSQDFAKIGEEISPAEEDLPAVVQLEDASGDPIEPYCPNLEEWIGEKANLNGDMTQNFSVKSLRFRTNPMNGKYSGLSYNVNTNRIVLTDTYGTSIISEPLAFQSDLSAYATLTSLSDYVTLATAQTISGTKTFSAALLASGGLRATSYIYPSADNSVFLGASSLRWSNVYSVGGNFSGNIMPASDNVSHIGQAETRFASGHFSTGAFSTFELRDYATGLIKRVGFSSDNNLLAIEMYSLAQGASTPTKSGTLYLHGGENSIFWQGNSAGGFQPTMNLGHQNARWSNVYSVNGNFSGALSVTGLITASGGVLTNSLTHSSGYDLVIGNQGNSDLIRIREDMQSYDTETIEDEEYPYWFITEEGVASFKSISINNDVASITSAGFATVNRLYLDANTYIYKDGNAWHLKSSVSGGSVNLIVDGDIACAG